MMPRKEFIGLSYDDSQLRLARMHFVRKKLTLVSVSTIPLNSPLSSVSASLSAFESGGVDDIFELEIPESPGTEGEIDEFDLLDDDFESAGAATDDFDLLDEAPQTGGTSTDEFNLVDDKKEDEPKSGSKTFSNEILLANQMELSDASKLIVGLHIPFGKTTFQLLKGVDPSKMKKKERLALFSDKLQPIHQSEVEPDHYTWIMLKEGSCLLAYSPDSNELINLVENTESQSRKKLAIHEKLPDEAIWIGLVRANYTLKEDEITGLIALGKTSSRVMFMKGDELISMLPIITEGEDSNNVLNTVFSKILFELDKGDLPKLDRLLLVQSSGLSEMAKVYFQKQFENITVDFLVPNPDVIAYSNKKASTPKDLQPYLSAIGAAWAVSKADTKSFSGHSLLPKYLLDKQQLYKIEWHGLIFLILIGLSPLLLNHLYNTKVSELNELQQEADLTELQIEGLRPTAQATESYLALSQQLTNESDKILNFAEFSTEWSEVMGIVNRGVSDIPGLWITSVRNTDNNLSISGYSLSRSSIPRLALLFTDVNIQNVVETDLRGETVYNFGITVQNFRRDISRYSPEMPVPVRMTETPAETTLVRLSSDESAVNRSVQAGQAPALEDQVTAGSQELPPTMEAEIIDVDIPLESTFDNITGPPDIPQQSENLSGSYSVVLQSVSSSTVAAERITYLEGLGYSTTLWHSQISDDEVTWRIAFGRFLSSDDALSASLQLPEELRNDLFIIRNL